MINVGVLQAILQLKDDFSPQLNKIADSLVKGAAKMAKVIAAAAVAATAATAVFLSKAAEAASRAEETQNLFEVAFGEMADAAEEWAQRTQKATGINDTTLKEFAATLQSILVPMGATKEGAFELSTAFTQLAFDISSLRNVPFEQAFNAIRSGLVGEAEPLKNLGISVLDNTIKQTDFAKSILATGRKLTEIEKIQARSIAILQQSGIAQGDLIKTQDSWANQTRLVGEAWTDMMETVGQFITQSEVLGSVVLNVTASLLGVSASLETNKEQWQDVLNGGVFFFLEGLAQTIRVMGFLVDATGAVTAGLGMIVQAVASVAQTILNVTPIFSALPESIQAKFQDAIDSVSGVGDSIRQSGEAVFEAGGKIGQAADGVDDAIQRIVDSTGKQGESTDALATFTEKYRSALELLEGGSLGAAAATGELTKAQVAHEKQVQSLVKSLGTSGLLREMELMKEGLERVRESGDRLSEQGFSQLSSAIKELIANGEDVPPLFLAMQQAFLNTDVGGITRLQLEWNESMREAQRIFSQMEGGDFGKSAIKGIRLETETAEQAQQEYNEALRQAADLARVIPGILGDIVSQTVAAAGALSNLSSGGIGKAFSGSGIGKALGKFGKVAGDLGPLVGIGIQLGTALVKGISSLFKSSPDLVRDAARDLGATISQELADSIEQSGRPLQLAVADLFRAGAFDSADRFAQEIGDIFSGLEGGAFGKPEAIRALEESVPLLLQNLEQLGPAGEAEIQRIIAAADRLGVEFEGLSELIQSTFAPATVESMAEQFGKTNAEIRAMGDLLGIDIQTDLERIAASVGLTGSEFKALGAALESSFGIPAAQLAEFLESTGVSAADLADKLGVSVGPGADLAAQADLAGQRLAFSADQAARLRDNLMQAARASAGIGTGSFDPGGGIPTTGAAHGFEGRVTGPRAFFIEPGVTEDVSIRRPGGAGGSDSRMDQVADYIAGGSLAKDLARAVRDQVAQSGRR